MIFGVDAGDAGTSVVIEQLDGSVVREQLPAITPTFAEDEFEKPPLRQLCEVLVNHGGDNQSVGWIGTSVMYRSTAETFANRLIGEAKLTGLHGTVVCSDDWLVPLFSEPINGVGVAITAGFGSAVVGRDQAGATVRRGGYGHLISDEGSAFDIGRRALRAVVRAHDGVGAPTALSETAQEHFGVGLAELAATLASTPLPKLRVADFALPVAEIARQGDDEAGKAIDGAAEDLAALTVSALNALNEIEKATMCGSISTTLGSFQGAFSSALGKSFPTLELLLTPDVPVCALEMARKVEADKKPPEETVTFGIETLRF